MIYILDTNVITDMMKEIPPIIYKIRQLQDEHILCLIQPVDYEIMRGLLHKGASAQILRYENLIRPRFQWISLTDFDWRQSAVFWADMTSRGKQLSDTDLLIASVAKRLNATIISADDDFMALPILRDNWRI
jgi:predicted nucleic acid-binding protein